MNALPRNDMSADAFLAKDRYTSSWTLLYAPQSAGSTRMQSRWPGHSPFFAGLLASASAAFFAASFIRDSA